MDVAAEDALEDGPNKRVVRAAEDDGVDAGFLERPCVLAHGLRRLGREGIGASISGTSRGQATGKSSTPASSA